MIPAATAAAASLLLVLQISSAAAQSGGVGRLRGCPSMCGDVSVPYPFGIVAGCYLPGFDLTCDRTHQPTRLLLGDGTLQVVEISLANSTVRVVDTSGAVSFTAYLPLERNIPGNGTWGGLGSGRGSTYVVSEQRNQLVVTGCNVQATLLGDIRNVITGCSSFCSIKDTWYDPVVSTTGDGTAACSGIGCCETPIPIGRPNYTVEFKYLDPNHEYNARLPLAVRIAERGWFDSVATEMLDMSKETTSRPTPVPVVLDWAVAATPLVLPGAESGNNSCPSCHKITFILLSGIAYIAGSGFSAVLHLSPTYGLGPTYRRRYKPARGDGTMLHWTSTHVGDGTSPHVGDGTMLQWTPTPTSPPHPETLTNARSTGVASACAQTPQGGSSAAARVVLVGIRAFQVAA